MKPTDHPGFLDPQLGDQTVDLPDHLNWNALGSGIIPPPKRKRPKAWLWLLLVGIVLLGFGAWQFTAPSPAGPESPAPSVPPATSKAQIKPQNNVTHTFDAGRKSPPLANDRPEEGGPQISPKSQLSAIDLQSSRGVTENSQASSTTTAPVTAEKLEWAIPGRYSGQIIPIAKQRELATEVFIPGLDFQLPKQQVFPNPEPNKGQQTAKIKVSGGQNNRRLLLGIGAGQFANAPDNLEPLAGLHASFQYRVITNKNWTLSLGTRLNRHVWRSQLNRTEAVQLFIPGTIDSIYVNPVTGEERIVTTDTVPGIARTRYRGYGKVTTLGLPIMVGKNWPLLGGQLHLLVGLEPTVILGRSGTSLNASDEIVSSSSAQLIGDDFQLLLSSGIEYHLPITPGLRAFGAISASWATREQFATFPTAGNWQQQQFAVGLSLRLGR